MGAVALALHGIVRGTQDVDLFVRPTEDNVARLRDALFEVWQDPAISEISAAELAGEVPVVRYTPTDEMTVDVIARIGEAFAFDQVEWAGEGPRGHAADAPMDEEGHAAHDRWSRRSRAARAVRAGGCLMPVQKFRTHEEARRALWLSPGDPQIPRRMRTAFHMAIWLYPVTRPRGVHKFRSIEEANAERKLWKRALQPPGRAARPR